MASKRRISKKGSSRARGRWMKAYLRKKNAGVDCNPVSQGRLLVPINTINESLKSCIKHASNCTRAELTIYKHKQHQLVLHCNTCSTKLTLPEEHLNDCVLSTDAAIVWGIYLAGSTYNQLNSVFTALELSGLSYFIFQREEEKIFGQMQDAVHTILKENGKAEYDECIKNGNTVNIDGKTYGLVTVIVDGSWAKRSYKQSYDSNAGMCVVIGYATGRVLWIGTRVKTCQKCKRNNGVNSNHNCQMNWHGSATSMEADIVVEAFNESMKFHNLIFSAVIGDGDSSTYASLLSRSNYPDQIFIRKFECVNHAVKNLNSKLFAILDNTSIPKGHRDFLRTKLTRFGKDARAAIQYNSTNQENENHSSRTDMFTLSDDIANIPFHIFGDHSKCKLYYQCNEDERSLIETYEGSKMWSLIMDAINYIAGKSDRLIANVTSNLAENFMSVVSKYLQGKRINFGQKYSYKMRVYCALFSIQFGTCWIKQVIKIVNPLMSNSAIWNSKVTEAKKSLKIKKSIANKAVKRLQRYANRHIKNQSTTQEYTHGKNAMDADMNIELFDSKVKEHMTKIHLSIENIVEIELKTRSQSLSDEWFTFRKKRITASNAGTIFKFRDSTNNSCVIKNLLYTVCKPLKNNDHRLRGQRLEPLARKYYNENTGAKQGLLATECGLFVSRDHGALAASPDGTVGDVGLLEIKCPNIAPKLIPSRKSNRFLRLDSSGNLCVNETHNYYYQVVMQIHVTEREWCDFYVFYSDGASKPETFRQRVFKSATQALWQKMKAKLLRFYTEDIVPEIVDPRFTRKMEIRQPEYRMLAISQAMAKRKNVVKTCHRLLDQTA